VAPLRPYALLLLAAAGCGPILRDDFESEPVRNGWTVDPPRPPSPATAGWMEGDARSGTRALVIEDGALRSPALRVAPLDWLRVRFAACVPGPAFCALEFRDGDGVALETAYSGIDPAPAWTDQELFFRVRSDAERARLRFETIDRQPLRIDDLLVETASPGEALAWADALYAALPPLTATPRPDRWARLPRTLGRLRNGERLRIVMLGDSIVHDIANSPFDLLLERLYPGARIEVVVRVAGGKGCWYFRTGNRVKDNVLRHRPDLLVIGGISHRGDVEAVRDVVRKVRAGSDCEILVMSGAVGAASQGDPRRQPGWRPDPDPQGEAYRDRLMRMAEEEQIAFFDFEGMWGRYIQACGRPYDTFLRDPVHANARGMQILARILAAFFAPPTAPE